MRSYIDRNGSKVRPYKLTHHHRIQPLALRDSIWVRSFFLRFPLLQAVKQRKMVGVCTRAGPHFTATLNKLLSELQVIYTPFVGAEESDTTVSKTYSSGAVYLGEAGAETTKSGTWSAFWESDDVWITSEWLTSGSGCWTLQRFYTNTHSVEGWD